MPKNEGWIGCDFDGTLSVYGGWGIDGAPGDPVAAMVGRVKSWLANGLKVKIFTARVSSRDALELAVETARIKAWCLKHIGQELEIVCAKDYNMISLYDDRAVQVTKNTGELPTEQLVLLLQQGRGRELQLKQEVDHLKTELETAKLVIATLMAKSGVNEPLPAGTPTRS
jgi:hypothetical protein